MIMQTWMRWARNGGLMAGIAVVAVCSMGAKSCQAATGGPTGVSASGPAGQFGGSDHVSGWPGASNTGPTAWALAHGNWRTEGGTTITHSGKYEFIHYTGSVDIEANNVSLINDTVIADDNDAGEIIIGGSGDYISRVTVSGLNSGSGRCNAGIKDKGGSGDIVSMISRVNVFWCSTGVQDIAGTLEDSYIHDPGFQNGDHINGETQNGSGTPLLIQHNYVNNNSPQGQTDAVSLFCDFGTEGNVKVIDNYLDGGGYALYGGNSGNEANGTCAASGHAPHGIVVEGNIFGVGAQYGPEAYFLNGGNGNVWSGNAYAPGTPKAGQAISP